MADKEPKEDKPKKPKPQAEVKLTVMDNGQIAGDYWIYEEDEIGRRKKWTVGGEDFFIFLNKAQQGNIPVIASAFNCQIVRAGLPENLQGPWLKRGEGGKLELALGNYVDGSAPVETQGLGKDIAERQELAAADALGMDAGEAAAALPHNDQAQAAAAGANDNPVAPPAPPAPAAPPVPNQ